MLKLLGTLFTTVGSALKSRRDLAMENLALRQQLAILKRERRRPRLTNRDRLFWVLLSKIWTDWAEAILIVKPETVIRWHRKGFKWFWRRKSQRRVPGRPKIDPEVRALILRLCEANPTWGAPRVHGELLKLGIEISQRTVGRIMPKRWQPPSQTWRTFLDNHVKDLVSIDFFVVPTATFRVLFVLVVLAHDRRRVVHFNVTEHPYVERIIGSIRRECLDHVVVLGERHLRRILKSYFDYYHRSRTHLSLDKDAPEPRAVHAPETGTIIEFPQVGGLHHRYERRSA